MSSVAKTAECRCVGRPRSFDEDQVLGAAMDVFWRKGYDGTSMADLLEATGLHKGSLYQCFGDKHTLFIRALRRYLENLKVEMSSVLIGGETAFEGMRKAMYKAVDLCLDEDVKHGCLALNTLIEKGPHDPEIMQVLEDAMVVRNRMILQAVRSCQAEGSLRSDWPAERITGLIETFDTGVVVGLKGPGEVKQAYALIDDLLALLQAPEAALREAV